jgi:3-hydroxyisobutyrate dehydrogenase-like beta-hydroxyacid dehydrogenase
MGAAIGGRLVAAGHTVTTLLAGRGEATADRARDAGFQSAESMGHLLGDADLFLSIVPPASAFAVAKRVAKEARTGGAVFDFIECNAISPAQARAIEAMFEGTQVDIVDGGIVGGPPADESLPRLYVSGEVPTALQDLDGIAFRLRAVDGGIGAASALKLCYAAITKGTNALLAAALLAAERHGLLDPLTAELSESQPMLYGRAEANISRLPADSARWAPEMRYVAEAFESVGVTGELHLGAARMLDLLADSIYGHETRRTRDTGRSALETIKGLS